MKSVHYSLAAVFALSVMITACSKPTQPPSNNDNDGEVIVDETTVEEISTEQPPAQAQSPVDQNGRVGMANPASVYCEEHGGKLVIITEGQGQSGYCHFKDGSICEEWAFYRNECKVGDSLQATP